jgi:hypothetical protein
MRIINTIITFLFCVVALLLAVMSNASNPTVSELETMQLMKIVSVLLCIYAGFLLILGGDK